MCEHAADREPNESERERAARPLCCTSTSSPCERAHSPGMLLAASGPRSHFKLNIIIRPAIIGRRSSATRPPLCALLIQQQQQEEGASRLNLVLCFFFALNSNIDSNIRAVSLDTQCKNQCQSGLPFQKRSCPPLERRSNKVLSPGFIGILGLSAATRQ